MTWAALLDVSHHQGDIDWLRVARSALPSVGVVRGAYLKATEHTRFVDNRYVENARRAAAVGLPTGAYHFARPSGSPVADARAEAQHFAEVTHATGHALPPMLDLEVTQLDAGATATWALEWCAEAQRLGLPWPIIYTGAYFGVAPRPELAAFALWIAAYPAGYAENPDPTTLRRPRIPQAWRDAGKTWSVWQYTSSALVDGVRGHVDANVCELAWLDQYLQPPTPAPDPDEDPMPRFIRLRGNTTQWLVEGPLSTTAKPMRSADEKAAHVKAFGIDATIHDVDDVAAFKSWGCKPDDELSRTAPVEGDVSLPQ